MYKILDLKNNEFLFNKKTFEVETYTKEDAKKLASMLSKLTRSKYKVIPA